MNRRASSRRFLPVMLLWVVVGCSQEGPVLMHADGHGVADRPSTTADLAPDRQTTDRQAADFGSAGEPPRRPRCEDVLSAQSPRVTPGVPVTGKIVYAGERGWYWFDHPCPNNDCTFTIAFTAGPNCPSDLQFVYEIHKNDGQAWFAFPANPQPGQSGSFGPPSQCLYALTVDGSLPYCISVSDLHHDSFSSECSYTFTVGVPTPGCNAPCKLVGSPPECSTM